MRRLLFAATLLVSALPLKAAEPCVTLDGKAVAALFDDWNFALSSLDASQVAKRYWPDAVLMPMASNTPSADAAAIAEYFKQFLVQRPRGHVDNRTIQSSCNLAVDTGTYTFSLMDDKGTTSNEAARYTFIYQYRDGAWKILNHHSSAMAVSSASPEVRVASEDAAKATDAAPPKAVPPAPRKPRWARPKDYLQPNAVAAKPAEKPVVDAKAALESKTAADAKAAAPVNAKLAAAATPAAAAPAPTDTKPSQEVRTAMFANLTSSPAPSKFYPAEAARHNEKGSVNLKVCADGSGAVSDAPEVVKSSGSKLLDEAAMTWARAVKWVPATYNRQRVEGCAKVDVSFEPPPV